MVAGYKYINWIENIVFGIYDSWVDMYINWIKYIVWER